MEQHLSGLVTMVPCSLILLASLLLTSVTKQFIRPKLLVWWIRTGIIFQCSMSLYYWLTKESTTKWFGVIRLQYWKDCRKARLATTLSRVLYREELAQRLLLRLPYEVLQQSFAERLLPKGKTIAERQGYCRRARIWPKHDGERLFTDRNDCKKRINETQFRPSR